MLRWKDYFENLTQQNYDKTEKQGKGQYQMTVELLKYIMEDTEKEKLLDLLNSIMILKEVPKNWNKGIILPLYKERDRKDYKNYRGTTLSSVPGKASLARILEKRLTEKLESSIEDTQHGFRKGRTTEDLIFIIRQISDKLLRKGKEMHVCFIDLKQAFYEVKTENV